MAQAGACMTVASMYVYLPCQFVFLHDKLSCRKKVIVDNSIHKLLGELDGNIQSNK